MKKYKNNMFQKTLDGLSREEAAHFWSYINDLKIDAGRVRNMKKNEKRLHNKINDLQARIDKAIEYIEKNIPYWEEWHYDCCLDTEDMNEIISLLKGEEE